MPRAGRGRQEEPGGPSAKGPGRRGGEEERDRQAERLRARLESLGWLAAIRGREGRPGDAKLPGLAHAVVIYARAMATIGGDAGVADARAWVRAALLREGGEAAGPFLHDREAHFADRLGLLAVLRGRRALLAGGD